MRTAALAAVLTAAAACAGGDPAAPLAPPARALDAPVAVAAAPPPPSAIGAMPKNIAELFDARMLPTCSLNGGVCHNSQNYPDLRDLAALADLVDRPCGANVDANFPDACEPEGDRLVASGVDVAILRAAFDDATTTATLTTDADVPRGALAAPRVVRALASGAFTFDVASASLEATSLRTIVVHLAGASPDVQAFFTTSLPLREDHVWPADVNGNGVAGASLGWRELRPGRPDRSWIVARLWDPDANPELMPRQCREWDDDATRALGCWIEGLAPDASNFSDDIDYAKCTFVVPKPGRCGTGITPDRIVDAQCAGCHGATDPAEGLDLRSISLRASTVGVPSHERPDLELVDPGNPDGSYLFLKIADGPPTTGGDIMPKGGHLMDAQVESLRSWIAAGAP